MYTEHGFFPTDLSAAERAAFKKLPEYIQVMFLTAMKANSNLWHQSRVVEKNKCSVSEFLEQQLQRVHGTYFYPDRLCPPVICAMAKIKLKFEGF